MLVFVWMFIALIVVPILDNVHGVNPVMNQYVDDTVSIMWHTVTFLEGQTQLTCIVCTPQ